MAPSLPVYLEVGKKKVFACALDWPGWARSGRDEQDALDALAAYATRYAAVVEAAHVRFPAAARRGQYEVVQRLGGNATTDFGAPDAIAGVDTEAITTPKWNRLISLLQGAWEVFDQIAASAPAVLTKGPRGGGRDRDEIVAHVIGAEASYARKVRAPVNEPDQSDTAAVLTAREVLVDGLHELRRTGPVDGPRGGKGWPARYAVRRLAWHVTDHAWEIEDKSGG